MIRQVNGYSVDEGERHQNEGRKECRCSRAAQTLLNQICSLGRLYTDTE